MENQELQEYVITLRSHEELEQFYDDLETPGGCDCIPEREVECVHRRNISRNTHYSLTSEEAEKLKEDERVLDVVPKSQLDMAIVKPMYTQTSSDWDRSITPATTNRNWSLLRCTLGEQISGWGANGTSDQTATIRVTSSGKNVDVVIVDGHLDTTHPEFAVNEDGTGGSRVIQYNWYQHTNELGLGANGTYVYPTGNDLLNGEDNHGMHVAGSVVGNSQGWARDANIYNLSPYSNNTNTLARIYEFDYIRAFHRNKAINPATGRKNPTICNNSWGSYYTFSRSSITNINWRGSNYTSNFTDSNLQSYGLVDFDATNISIQNWDTSLVADIEDAINDGIILVGAAGNDSMKIDISGGTDYNNTITWSGGTLYYHRGSWNTIGSNAICVGGATANQVEVKASYSNTGPRVDIFSPGRNIISSLHTSGSGVTLVDDYRNSSYKLGKYDGTSMASPQVCGVIACLLEQNPRMKQTDVVNYLIANSKSGQLTDSTDSYTNNLALQGANNRYLYYRKERQESGFISPRTTYSVRRSSGQVYPRTNTVTYGR